MPRRKRIDLKPKMRAVKGVPAEWDIGPIVHAKDLAGWLGLSESKMQWLADLDNRVRSSHYVCRWIKKRCGFRLIESPKSLLKKAQRQILDELLRFIPESTAAHGFVRGRNVSTFVAEHLGKPLCLKMDLKDFFPSIRAGRIFRLFDRLGYPSDVSRALTGLCTTATRRRTFAELPAHAATGRNLVSTYAPRHLPQGAPTSPALSNFCAFKLDCRLSGLATSLGGNYSRYADDLLFSFGNEFHNDKQAKNRVRRLISKIGSIAIEEGFSVNFRKTRVMCVSQRQISTGVILNEKPNVPRHKFDRLKAILNNCRVLGPKSQNKQGLDDFRAHLAGQVAWIRHLNPAKAEKLDRLFEQIDWNH